MSLAQQPVHRRPATKARRKSRLPRIHWGWYAAATVIVIAAARTHPILTTAVITTVLLSLILAAARPRRLARLFRPIDQFAARLPKRSAIPRQATAAKLQNLHWSRFEEAGIQAARQTPGVVEAVPTGKSGDRGCDGQVRLVNGQRWLLQFKRYNAKKKVDGETVRATVGAAHLAGCTGAAIVTSSGFTKKALEEAVELGVVLFDGDDSAAWMNGGRAPWQ